MVSGIVISTLLAASPALADSGVRVSAQSDTQVGLHLGSLIHHSENDQDGTKEDSKDGRGVHSNTHLTASTSHKITKEAFLSAIGAAGAGVVTSVQGSAFTLAPFGTHATTTVETNASTTYKVNGVATTSSAVAVGSRAIVFGTTDSDGITASFVSILNIGFGWLKHFFH